MPGGSAADLEAQNCFDAPSLISKASTGAGAAVDVGRPTSDDQKSEDDREMQGDRRQARRLPAHQTRAMLENGRQSSGPASRRRQYGQCTRR